MIHKDIYLCKIIFPSVFRDKIQDPLSYVLDISFDISFKGHTVYELNKM